MANTVVDAARGLPSTPVLRSRSAIASDHRIPARPISSCHNGARLTLIIYCHTVYRSDDSEGCMRANDARESARRKKAFGDALRTLLDRHARAVADDLAITPSALYALARRGASQMPSAERLRQLALVCEAEAERLALAARVLHQESYRVDALSK
jgi:hypothetical protein